MGPQPVDLVCRIATLRLSRASESQLIRQGNLEGSVRSHRKHGRWRECDLTEAGLNEAADGWALWG